MNVELGIMEDVDIKKRNNKCSGEIGKDLTNDYNKAFSHLYASLV